MKSKRLYLCLLMGSGICSTPMFASGINFSGSSKSVIEIVPDKSTGLDKIYVLNDLSGVELHFESVLPQNVEWYMYSNLGAGYAIPLKNIHIDNGVSTLKSIEGNRGYIIEANGEKYCFWVVDYSAYKFCVNDVLFPEEQDCESTHIRFEGIALPIYYYTINGKQEILSRDIQVCYNNLVWDEDDLIFRQQEIIQSLQYIKEEIIITPPLFCRSAITISGDRFSEIWNDKKIFETGSYIPHSVMVKTTAEQYDINKGDNIAESAVESLGGSAPCTVRFDSFATDEVSHTEWQLSGDELFENLLYRITEASFEYTFTEEGSTYVRCVVSNEDGSCESHGEVYRIDIGTSVLNIPNVFSPDGDGINDEWKVSYSSLLDFKCWIFDRQGHQVFYTEDPSIGWDGRRGNKPIRSGVYYYIITATGSDGKNYRKSGDINVLLSKSINVRQ